VSDYIAGGRALGSVPRTTDATDGAGVVRAVAQRTGRPTAWWGMLILVTSEAMLFAAFIGTYYYLRFETAVWPPDGIPEPRVIVPIVLAVVLALSAVPVHIASTAAQTGRLASARLYLVLALVVQCGYIAYEIHDFRDQLRSFDVTRDAYSSIYFTLLGADHAHVILGILFSLWLLWKLARGLTTYRANAAMAIALYWGFVAVLTLVVTGTLVSARV
jgi:heme/copper-type cytochrome/quinol oxidase subunit 3